MSGTPATSGSQNVFAVNTIDFHKVHGTFCTGGSDGSLTVWDGFGRTKVKRELHSCDIVAVGEACLVSSQTCSSTRPQAGGENGRVESYETDAQPSP
jgi:WD40 repeat protein